MLKWFTRIWEFPYSDVDNFLINNSPHKYSPKRRETRIQDYYGHSVIFPYITRILYRNKESTVEKKII